MPRKIKILSEEISQTIAAGEVIERPASVVKELMENAIDAGSSEIIVELKMGGFQCIRVCDNGEGIDSEDVSIALQRYATSKITRAEDLYDIHTLGFRGEALSSIASVSKTIIKTRVADAISGTKVVCKGGEIESISEVGCPVGTEVKVQDIFYNLPVKRKFLKSIRSELRYCLSFFLRLSLSNPLISFKFIHDGRMLYEHLKTGLLGVRIEAILGREIAGQLRMCEFDDGEIRVSGYTSQPSLTKGNQDGIYLYINRRFVKDRMINKAINEAYRNIIPNGKFPVVILFITISPAAIDVNVHPTKSEVKFRDSERVFRVVTETLRSTHNQTGIESKDEEKKSCSLTPFPKQWEQPGFVPAVSEPVTFQWKMEEKISYRILGQFHGTFILCELNNDLIFIDQHAAHERILFNKYKNEYETKRIVSENFLIPVLIELSIEESFILNSHLQRFQSIGIETDSIGDRVYAIRSKPNFVDQGDLKTIVKEILEKLSFLVREKGEGIEVIDMILKTLACHTAIRGNFIMRREEMEELVKILYPFDLSNTCPHGRPMFYVFKLDELNKQFKRKS